MVPEWHDHDVIIGDLGPAEGPKDSLSTVLTKPRRRRTIDFVKSLAKVVRGTGKGGSWFGGEPARMSVSATVLPEKATHQQTRTFNQQLVLRALHDHSPLSRADLARLTGLTRTSVSDSSARSSMTA